MAVLGRRQAVGVGKLVEIGEDCFLRSAWFLDEPEGDSSEGCCYRDDC